MITVSVFKEGQQHAFKLKIVPLMWLSNLLFEVNVQENPVKIMIWAMLSKLSEIYHFLRFTNGNSVKVPCSGRGGGLGDYENLVFHPSTKPENFEKQRNRLSCDIFKVPCSFRNFRENSVNLLLSANHHYKKVP